MNSTISPKATLGKNVCIGHNVTIHDEVVIGDNVTIEDNTIIGYNNLSRIYDASYVLPKLMIGDGCLIRAGAILYRGTEIGKNAMIAHNVLLREGMHIGDHTIIGNAVMAEGYTRIGRRCVIQAQSHLTAFMTVSDYVFFGPGVMTMNDNAAAHYRPHLLKGLVGPKVGRGVRLGGGVILSPGVNIGDESFVGAGALVVKDIPKRELWFGVPARKIRDIGPEEALQEKD